MTPETFIRKWKASSLTERAAAQPHFLDLCALLEEPTPAEADPTGEHYAFERGATKTTGGKGWADVWKRGYFAWEYKGKQKDLRAAYAQLQQYAVALENPPLLTVCDMETFEIHTNWTNTVHEVHRIGLEDLREASCREKLKSVFSEPERLKPGQTRQALTEKAAEEFAGLALRLRARGHDPQRVAHFVNRLVFCMFAEDLGLLRGEMFRRLMEQGAKRPDRFPEMASQLFTAMRDGGLVGFEEIAWFNGGLFDDGDSLPIEKAEIDQVLEATKLDWAEIDPALFGTLFERGLDPDKRSQLGAHYTDRDKIMMIIKPVIIDPLLREWEEAKRSIKTLLQRATNTKTLSLATRAAKEAKDLYTNFLERLKGFRVLDPACGSGNFLYLALLALKDLEHKVNLDAEALGFHRAFPAVGPEAVRGIEVNPYAAELARVSVWIGEIQWMRRNGFAVPRNPILKPLENIECRDAVLNPDGTEAAWPKADAIIGNPPFLGDRDHRTILGEEYTVRLRAAYDGRVRGRADLVVYWLQKAVEKTLADQVQAFGFVTTKSVAKGASRAPLDLLTAGNRPLIHDAWTNEPWVVEGAAVRVSVVCGMSPSTKARFDVPPRLNGATVVQINPDLSSGVDVTKAMRLTGNASVAFQGVKLTGPFDISGEEARALLCLPLNPNGCPNSDVVARLYDIDDIVGRDSDRWVVDFGCGFDERRAALYERPFRVVMERVIPYRSEPERAQRTEKRLKEKYWEFERPRPEMRRALVGKARYIITPESSEHRVFVFVPGTVRAQGSLFCIARDDDATLGILSSRFHEVWSTAQGNRLGAGNQRRYNVGVTFETFPFPDGLTPDIPAAGYAADSRAQHIAAAARTLDDLRNKWLNPADLVRREPEVVAGYPNRILPVGGKAAAALKQRTLTNLYNERPVWLANAHRELDEAVAAAYGWPADLSDDEVLSQLLKLNQKRAAPAREDRTKDRQENLALA